jgi:hypothetical protein
MPALIVFVCEGPTCIDRWETPEPRAAIASGLAARGDGRGGNGPTKPMTAGVRLERETCLGHCRRGPNICSVPPVHTGAGADPMRPLPESPGARIHHGLTVAGAVAAIEVRLSPPELGVAANSELA